MEFTEARVPPPPGVVHEMTIGDALRQAAAAAPNRVALVDGDAPVGWRRRLTHAELLAEAERGARALLGRFQPGERVAVWSPNSVEWLLLQMSAALAGLTLVTVNPAYRATELAYVLGQSCAAGVLHAPSFRAADLRQILADVRPSLPALRDSWLLTEWEQLVRGVDPSTPLPVVRPGDAAQIQYTSGTTGAPKGALLHHRGLVNNARFIAERFGVPDGAVWLNQMPLFHVAGSQINALGALAARASQVVCTFDPGRMLALVEEERPYAMIGAPTMYLMMLEHPDTARRDLSSLRVAAVGGAPCSPDLGPRVERATGGRFVNFYGMTETCGMSLQTLLDDEPADRFGTIGRALPGSAVKIADPRTGATVPLGAVGEICVRGYQVMTGYFELPSATAEALDGEGCMHTGDLGSMDARGVFRIEGRVKDMIIRGGENIYPREIEDVIATHPAVAQAVVLGVPDTTYGEIVGAVVRLRGEAAADLFAHCRVHLAGYKSPRLWWFIDAFPLTPSGKVQKFVLRERIVDGKMHEPVRV